MGVFNHPVHTAILTGALILISCRTVQPGGPNQARAIAVEKLGENIDSWPNTSGLYILYCQKPGNTASGVIKFIVVSVNGEVVEEQNYTPGYVKWVTETSLEVLSMPSTMKSNEDLSKYTKVIHLRTPN